MKQHPTYINKLSFIIATALLLPTSAFATNGYFSHGYGIKAKGMGGAGVAYGQDGLAAATNPANTVLVGNRVDFGLDLFTADRKTEVASPNPGATTYDANGTNNFLIPEFGYIKAINQTMSWGISVYGNGGMNVDYDKPVGLFSSSNPNADKLYMNLEQLFILPTFSMKLNQTNAFGVSLVIAYQTFEAKGLDNFNSAAQTSNVGSVTGNGVDSSNGFGLKLGWTGEITPMITLGATYQSKTTMGKFDKYKGLFAEDGGFDIPSTYGIGIKITASSKMNIAFDISQINYTDVASISNPLGPVDGATGQLGNTLGTSNGAGFGWNDMTVFKLGLDYQLNSKVVLRAGYNRGDQPIPEGETFFNLLAPAVVEDHFTLGGTIELQNGSELSFSYMNAFENTVQGKNSIPAIFGGGEANLTMAQAAYGIAYGWQF